MHPTILIIKIKMIKNEIRLKQQKAKVCLNPQCPLSDHRVFSLSDPHAFSIPCLNWIMDLKKYDSTQIEDREEIAFRFGRSTLKENINSCLLINSINLEIYFNILKEQLILCYSKSLNLLFQDLTIKFKEIPTRQIIDELAELADCLDDPRSDHIADFIAKAYIEPHSKKDLILRIPMLGQLKPKIEQVGELKHRFYYQKPMKGKEKAMTEEENEKIKKFILDTSSPFNKLQEIASLCNRKMNGIRVAGTAVKVDCPFCDLVQQSQMNKVRGTLKQLKKLVSDQLLTHCFLEHSPVIIEHASKKIEPQTIKKDKKQEEIGYEAMVEEARRFQKLRIIDRQSGIAYQAPPNDAYCIEVLSKVNKNMSKTRHILTEDRKMTQLLIYFIILDFCFIRKTMNVKNVSLESNSCSMDKAAEIGNIIKSIEFAHPIARKQKVLVLESVSRCIKKEQSQKQIDKPVLVKQQF